MMLRKQAQTRLARLLGSLLLITVLSGCATLDELSQRFNPPPQPVKAPELARAFAINGRFSLSWNDQSWIGGIDWKFAPAHETLALSVAGQSFAQFERYENVAKAQMVDGKEYEGTSWSDLTARMIGVALPLEAAPYWVRGVASPHSQSQTQSDSAFVQNGWRIETLARDEKSREVRRMRWQNDRATFTLVIDAWN